ncbi:MAG: phage major capsid protein [Acidobacteriaceae bacterium]
MSDQQKLPVQYRAAEVSQPKDGERLSGADPGRFEMALSSEEPYLRNYWQGPGNEILLHDKKNVRTGRLDAGMVPLLFNHDPDQQLGIVDQYALKGGKLHVSGRFGPGPLAQEKRGDYDAGILKAASVGYRVHKMVRTEAEDENGDAIDGEPARCEVKDWEPFDASLVTVPADPTVGVGRDARGAEAEYPVEIETVMRRSAAQPQPEPVPAADSQPEQEIRIMAETATTTSPAEVELKRVEEILAVAADKDFGKYLTQDEVRKALNDKTSADAFKDMVTRKIVDANDAGKVGTAGGNLFKEMEAKDQKRFSVFRLVRSLTNSARPGTFSASVADATMEREFSEELKKRLKISTEGPLIPDFLSMRALGTQGIGSGSGQLAVTSEAAAVETITRPEVIELLRNRPRVEQLGARRLGGLQGVVRLPRQSGAGTAQWVTEGAAVSPADLAMDYVSVTPHRISAQTAWTVELLAETSPDVEGLARADQDKIILLALDLAAIEGSGTSGQPTGLMNITGLTLLSPNGTAFTDGGQPLVFTDVLAFEKTVAAANADVATCGFMFTPEVRAQLKATPKYAVTSGGTTVAVAEMIWPDSAKDPLGLEQGPLGYKAGVTNQLPKNGTKGGVTGSILHTAIFGDWSQLILADWGAREIVVDPYTQAASGAIVVTQRSLHDIACRHIVAFAANPYIAIS